MKCPLKCKYRFSVESNLMAGKTPFMTLFKLKSYQNLDSVLWMVRSKLQVKMTWLYGICVALSLIALAKSESESNDK